MKSCAMNGRRLFRSVLRLLVLLPGSVALVAVQAAAETVIDFSAYQPTCAVEVQGWNSHLRVSWPTGERDTAIAVLNLSGDGPLLQQLATSRDAGPELPILAAVDPVMFLTVGQRRAPDDKPREQRWEVFFDNPAKRPHETFPSKLTPQRAKVSGAGQRATVSIEGLSIGPFAGTLELSFYAGSRLMRVDAVVETQKDGLAIFYDSGLVARRPTWKELVWIDTEGRPQRQAAQRQAASPPDAAGSQEARPLKVRHRAVVASGDQGSLACFPPPHQFQFPRDYSTNLGFVWAGEGYQGLAGQTGFGIRQQKDGGGNFVPWFNAPPGVEHRLGVFYLLTSGNADDALKDTLRLTHGDRFVELPGYKTFSSHYHMAIAVHAMEERSKGLERSEPPDYVSVFKNMGVNMVHLAEFHGDGHPKDPGPLRLPEMQAMFDECRRWSDDSLLLMPGEEGNDFLGLKIQGKHPGHWMSLFPRPVYWTMTRAPDQPFVEDIPPYGRVYHVGSRGDMIRLLKEEHGLVWSAHPRIKASSWTPDIFREEDFFIAPFWLGGAWKAMPGDLSREKLGERVLNLLDDMANWGQRKYAPGEVDVFTIDRAHELYGHMNVNYLQLDRVPRYADGWQSALDALSGGKFFVTTGEILIPKFTVGGAGSGDVLKLAADDDPELVAELSWTFPLAFAEIVTGDGANVYRQRIDLRDTTAFGSRKLSWRPSVAGRRWVRFEIWDIAANGAFTQPVWIEAGR
jgi:hypothetical protein